MKKLCLTLSAVLLLTCLAACGGEEAKAPFDPETTAQTLLNTPGVFSETLERLDTVVAVGQYELEGYLTLEQNKYKPIDPTAQYGRGGREDLVVVAYASTGSTAEELAVLRFGSEEDAEGFETAAWAHIADQKEANETYRPAEMPKLEKAVVERRGSTVLVLVCADYEAAQAALDG